MVKDLFEFDYGLLWKWYEATGAIPEPVWPEDMTFQSLVETAFRGRIITGLLIRF